MVGVREIPRTAAFAWSPSISKNLIATGTRAGAVDANFSDETRLEVWDLQLENRGNQELQPIATVQTDSRFYDLAWGPENEAFPHGILAGALENGSFDLWNAKALLDGHGSSHMSRTSKHTGAVKALQFNPSKPLLATAGAKSELYITDLNNPENPFRMGNAVARADDFECLDWNKKVPHILATGTSGGFVTVWDVSKKKESLTLNKMGKKAISALAWDPEKHTRLVTACRDDSSPLILVWDLRNSSAPERILTGHDEGVLSLSWCPQDNDLLLSCGMDHRSVCWNPQTGENLGEFPIVTHWTVETRWNPSNPDLLATASLDGKIAVHALQNTATDVAAGSDLQTSDDADFFDRSQQQPRTAGFALRKAPKWHQRPCGAVFGFGGKLFSFKNDVTDVGNRSASITIDKFASDTEIASSIDSFEQALDAHDLTQICKDRLSEAKTDEQRADWEVIISLTGTNPRTALTEYLGFSGADGVSPKNSSNAGSLDDGGSDDLPSTDKSIDSKNKRLSAFFEEGGNDGFLSDLAATKGAKTNSPFQIYTGRESDADKQITQALLLGNFEAAMDNSIKERRLSDAFMIAVCGGPQCIEKAQRAYFRSKRTDGPNYLRLLASIAGENLWDTVYNADLASWKEVMAALCCYATPEEFPDLCEGLGDRIEEQLKGDPNSELLRKNASFCYLAGSKLEKVVDIWLQELQEYEQTHVQDETPPFAMHMRCLQSFIEKVTIFREVTNFNDPDKDATSAWKLGDLYDRYIEYADVLSANGQLQAANRYLDLLPSVYPAAKLAKERAQIANRKVASQNAKVQGTARPSANPGLPQKAQPAASNALPPTTQLRSQTPTNPYAPVSNNYPSNPYTPSTAANGAPYVAQNGYPHGQPAQPAPKIQPGIAPPPTSFGPNFGSTNAPPRAFTNSPSVPPPSQAKGMTNWNDTPESFFKAPPPRRPTPSAAPQGTNSGYMPQAMLSGSGHPSLGTQPRPTPSNGPPPRGPLGPPPRNFSPSTTSSTPQQNLERPSSSAAANTYAPSPSLQQNMGAIQPPQRPPIPRGPSPYNAPPSVPPPGNRYAPNLSTQDRHPDQPTPLTTPHGPPPPNPYASSSGTAFPQRTPSQPSAGPPPGGPPRGPPQPPPHGRPSSIEQAAIAAQRSSQPTRKYPPGDRTHIPSNAQSILDILSSDFQRVKAKAPPQFKAHVTDAEKRLNLLYDHLNNEDLLQPDTIESMVELSEAIRDKHYDQAQAIHIDLVSNKSDQCGQWMVGVKRLIAMSRATP